MAIGCGEHILNFSTKFLFSLVSTWASPGDFVLQCVVLKEVSKFTSAQSPTAVIDFHRDFFLLFFCVCVC